MGHIVKVFGPPGTGKTTWLLNKMGEEIDAGTPPRRIGYLTFSRAASEEASDRARARLPGLGDDDFRYFKTIHAICFAEIEMSRGHMMDTKDYLRFGRSASIQFSAGYTEDYGLDGAPLGWGSSRGGALLNVLQVASARQTSPEDYNLLRECSPRHKPISLKEFSSFLAAYRQFKEKECRFDFMDLLDIYMRSGEPLPIDVLFVDEAQDLSKLQWAVIHKMMARAARVYIAGDDDQSIYGFLGADPYGFLDHPYDSKIILNRSYRLREEIWRPAERIINRVSRRETKEVAVDPGGLFYKFGSGFTPEMVIRRKGDNPDLKDFMVIARTHQQLVKTQKDLDLAGVPYSYKGNSITGGREASIFHCYHKARKGSDVPIRDAARLARSLQLPGAKSLVDNARLQTDRMVSPGELTGLGVQFHSDSSSIDYLSRGTQRVIQKKLWDIARRGGIDSVMEPPRVSLHTYHSCKGREADCTILLSEGTPRSEAHEIQDLDFGRRLAFVGLTRARKEAYMIMSGRHPMMAFKYA